MWEPLAMIGTVSLLLVGLIAVMMTLQTQIRTSRHLARLKQIPLDQWPGRR